MTARSPERAVPTLSPPADMSPAFGDAAELALRQARADRLLAAEGAGHLVHDLPVRADGRSATIESRPWRLDPIPLVLDDLTFARLATAVAERMSALEAVLADLYGPRTLLRDRVVPAEVLAGSPRYRLGSIGSAPTRWLTTYAVDLAPMPDGSWVIVQDLTDAPPGLGYALLDRSVITRVWPDVVGAARFASLGGVPGLLRRALAARSPVDSPRIVLFSGGLDHPSYVDHSYLAVQLGINLVEGADLVVRQRRVWLRTLERLEPVDVLYRRLEDRALDPLEVGSTGSVGVPGLAQAVRSAGVVVANAPGSGVLEAPAVREHLDAAIAHCAGRAPVLPWFDGVAPLGEVSIAPGSTGESSGPSTAPVVVRMFAVHDGSEVVVLPAATGRLLAPGDDPSLPTACVAKDVWVMSRPVPTVVASRLPQVDFGRSVPTRAADALYWTNRAAERAEAMARTMRVVRARLDQEPDLAGSDRWSARTRRLLAAIARHGDAVGEVGAVGAIGAVEQELTVVGDAVAEQIGSLLTEATTVREYLSVTTGRVLAHLAELRTALGQRRAGVEELDAVLADFAALAGLWQESTVRGPAWHIGDVGRRLERCLVVADLVGAARPDGVIDGPDDEQVDATVTEILLAANDSLVAYRRRHRSDVEWSAALELLVRDPSNPRSIAASVDRLAAEGDDGRAVVSDEFLARVRAALGRPDDELIDRSVDDVKDAVAWAGRDLVARWFSTPVNPIAMRSRFQPVTDRTIAS
ncbi:MAG: circularly permuted type 2 ATP-grasp protein [Ilumatobacteraceae bacterium]